MPRKCGSSLVGSLGTEGKCGREGRLARSECGRRWYKVARGSIKLRDEDEEDKGSKREGREGSTSTVAGQQQQQCIHLAIESE